MIDRKVFLNKHTNLLELEEHMYPLVDVEKRDGRVYYTIKKDTIRETIASLSWVFLGESK